MEGAIIEGALSTEPRKEVLVLRELIEAWKGESLQKRMLDEFDEMLSCGEKMYELAAEALLSPATIDEDLAEVRRLDARIKELEEMIRRQLIEHLTIRPGKDVTGSLIMMSVVKDAERIGDLARKIFKMRSRHERKFEEDDYAAPLKEVREGIHDLFEKVRQAFREGDVEAARDVVVADDEIGRQSNGIIRRLYTDSIECERAVTYTMLARLYHRASAHLANIATSVLAPAHKLDLPADGAEGEGQDEST